MPLLKTHEGSLAYGTAGDAGPPVLLVQGTGAVGEGWRPQIDDLARDHRVAWFDNRGIGASVPFRGPVSVADMARDGLALMDHLGWQSAHLVGHSLGGVIVQEAARLAPARVRSLALLSTMRRGRDVFGLSLGTLWRSLRMRVGSERSRWLAFAEMGLPHDFIAVHGAERAIALMRAAFCQDFLESPPIVRRQLLAMWRHTGGDMAPLRQLPVLIVTGAEDQVVSTRHSDDLHAHLPRARLVRIAGAGHAVTLQLPERVNALLREHIAASEPAAPIAGAAAGA